MSRVINSHPLYPSEKVMLMVGNDPVPRALMETPYGPTLYIEQDDGPSDSPYTVHLYGTGHPFETEGLEYIASLCMMRDGALLSVHAYKETT